MKREKRQRIKLFEIYIDEKDDLLLAIKKLDAALNEINRKQERIVLVAMDELKYPEE